MEFSYKKPTLEVLELIAMAKKSRERVADLAKFLEREDMHILYDKIRKGRIVCIEENPGLESIKNRTEERLNSLKSKQLEDPDNENHVMEVNKTISEYYSQILDLENAILTMDSIKTQNSSLSLQTDIFLCRMRMAIIMKDKKLLESSIKDVKILYEKGCDWDRRNKFKVYQAMYFLKKGEFKQSAYFFSESLPTFESFEICSYQKAVIYTIFTGLLSFSREDLEKKIITSSDILEIKNSIESAYNLAKCLYDCKYSTIFRNLDKFLDEISDDVHLKKYRNRFCQEFKLRAYRQLLSSYESLALVHVANIFCVSIDYIEKDLIKYIASDRLMCKIDKVDNIIFVVKEENNNIKEFLTNADDILKMIKKRLK